MAFRAALVAFLLLSTAPCPTAAKETLEQRVANLEAERDIRAILIRYGSTLDARDYDGYAGLFAQQGVWVGGFGSFTGPAAIKKMLVDNMGVPEPGFVNKANFHMLTNPQITVSGDKAHAVSHWLFWAKGADGKPTPMMAGRYTDDLVLEGGAWKIARRVASGIIPFSDPANGVVAGRAAAGLDPAPTGPAGTTDQRLRLVEDTLAIQRLQVEYSSRIDAHDIDGYVALFAPDATWQVGNLIKRGSSEIRALVAGLFPQSAPGFVNMESVTLVVDPRIQIDGDHAKGTVRHVLLKRGDGGHPTPVLTGLYTDEYVRLNGTWKIQRRVDMPVMPTATEWGKEMAARKKAG